MRIKDPDKAIFPIGVVADMTGISQRQLRMYERKGIIRPGRSDGNRRLYSQSEVELLTFIHYLVSIRRVNLAGIKVVLELTSHFPEDERHRLFARIEREIDELSERERSLFEAPGELPEPTEQVDQDS
jgi:MerR family transcriptional regulator/heat shock protein HspR